MTISYCEFPFMLWLRLRHRSRKEIHEHLAALPELCGHEDCGPIRNCAKKYAPMANAMFPTRRTA